MSFGITLLIESNLGATAWDVLSIGLFLTFGLTVGTWAQIVGFVLLLIIYALERKIPKIGTVLNMILVGIFIDVFLWLLPSIELAWLQYTMMLSGIVIMGMGSGMYITSKLGAGPRDGLMLVLSNRLNWSIKKIKTVMEIVVLIIGWFLGGPVFIGTFLFSIFIGPIMQFFISWWGIKLNRILTFPTMDEKRGIA